jgi:hypothetical protein
VLEVGHPRGDVLGEEGGDLVRVELEVLHLDFLDTGLSEAAELVDDLVSRADEATAAQEPFAALGG